MFKKVPLDRIEATAEILRLVEKKVIPMYESIVKVYKDPDAENDLKELKRLIDSTCG